MCLKILTKRLVNQLSSTLRLVNNCLASQRTVVSKLIVSYLIRNLHKITVKSLKFSGNIFKSEQIYNNVTLTFGKIPLDTILSEEEKGGIMAIKLGMMTMTMQYECFVVGKKMLSATTYKVCHTIHTIRYILKMVYKDLHRYQRKRNLLSFLLLTFSCSIGFVSGLGKPLQKSVQQL